MSFDSQQMSNAAGLMAAAAGLHAEVQGMIAENQEQIHKGMAPIYIKVDFERAVNAYGCHHNAIVTALGMHL